MKSVGSFSKWIACGVAAAAMMMVSSAHAAAGKAVVRVVRGTAQYSVQGGEWTTLTKGKVLGPASSVKTGVSSQVDLFLAENGPTVRVLADTTVALDKLSIDRTGVDVVVETSLDLKAGTIQGAVEALAAASKYEVKTPFTVCAIKENSQYQISADGTLNVIMGSILVGYRGPTGPATSTVNAGQTFVPAPPTQPNAPPTVRPTRPDEAPPSVPTVFQTPGPLAPVTAPPPIQFVSPGTGRPASGS